MCDTIESVSSALEDYHTSQWLGFDHLTRENAIQYHSRDLFNIVYGVSNSPLFLIMDGTYIYIEKPEDFRLQKMTYSGQKSRNLVKPFMIILPSGYIMDASGPFFADGKNNDSGILHALLNKDGKLFKYFRKDDHFIVKPKFK